MYNTAFSEIAWSGENCPNCFRRDSIEVIILLADIPVSYNQYCPNCMCLFSDEHKLFLKYPWVEQD